MYELLSSERQAIIDYALKHPEVRHRELAWKMLDEGVVAVSASSVYRVLREADLVCRWKPKLKAKGHGRDDKPTRADEKWQTDIKYVRVGSRNYYLLSFMDVYSRYIVHHELLSWMDGQSVSVEAAAAIATLDANVRPDIQSDHGSGFIAREFAETLSATGVTHTKIRPHTPTDNAEIERYHTHHRRADRGARAAGLRPGPGGDRRDHRGLRHNPAALGVVVFAAGGLLSR